MILGQEKICELIDKLNLDTFPRSLMLVGPEGSGKHLICEYIANKLGLITFDITNELTQESIDAIYERVQPYLYIISINKISVKEENTILKFLEEPLKNSYIVLVAESDIGILTTILNRCQIWYLQNYTKDVLRSFITNNNEYILDIATTPGQVKKLCESPFDEMIELSYKILTKIDIASIPNTLTLSNKMSWKQEKDKYDPSLFISIMLSCITKSWKQDQNIRYVEAYNLTSQLKKDMAIKNVEHRYLFDKYLIDLRSVMKGTII